MREEEFSPLKNGDDAKKETPTTCRLDLSSQHTKWLEKAGAIFQPDKEPNGHRNECEISPLVSYDGEDLAQLVSGKLLSKPLKIECDKAQNKIYFNDTDIETYEKKNCLISA